MGATAERPETARWPSAALNWWAGETTTMDRPRTAAAAGVVVGLATVAAVVAPYLLLPPDVVSGLSAYYGTWVLGPQVLVVLALVAVVALVGGLRGQTPHGTAAGVAVGLGAVALLVAVGWAMSVPDDLVMRLGRATWLGYHRWVVVALTVAFAGAAGLYARVAVA